jgi:chloramphenicol 3-O-phosphotransferase
MTWTVCGTLVACLVDREVFYRMMARGDADMNSIILLSGPIGAGKSTVARELVAGASGPTVYIEGDKFWFFITKPAEGRARQRDFKTIMTAMTAASVPYALAGYEVILDFSIPPWFLDTARRVAKVKDVPLDFVVLRPSEEVCSARAAARVEGAIADYAPYRDLYSSFDGSEKYTICDDVSEAKIVAARIRKGLSEGAFRLA